MVNELATGYVSIVAETSQLASQIGREMASIQRGAVSQGKRLGTALAKGAKSVPVIDTSDMEARFATLEKSRAAAVKRSTEQITALRRKEEIAQAELTEAEEKYEAGSAKVLRAKDKLATASQKVQLAEAKETAEAGRAAVEMEKLREALDEAHASNTALASSAGKTRFQTLLSSAKTAGTGVKTSFKSAATSARDSFKQLAGGDVKGAFGQLKSTASGAMGDVKSVMKRGGREAGVEFGDGLEAKTKDAGKQMGPWLKAGIVGLAAKLGLDFGQQFADAIGGASDLEQSAGAVEAVFKGKTKEISKAASSAATDLGLSTNAYNELASVLGAGLKNKGLDDFAGQTQNLIGLGADLAAQYGGSTSDAVDALSSLMRGESDPIEKYGISINETAIKAQLAAKGQDKLKGAALEQAKAQARVDLVMKQSADAQGAFSRESDTLAGKQQRAAAQWENLRTKIGGAFLPALSEATGFLSEKALPGIEDFGGKAVNALGGVWTFLSEGKISDKLKTAFGIEGDNPILAWFSSLRDGIVTTIQSVSAKITPIVTELVGWFQAKWQEIGPTVMGVVGQVRDTISSGMQAIQTIIQTVTDVIAYIWSNWGENIKTQISIFIDTAVGFFSGLFTTLKGIFDLIVGVLTGDWRKAGEALKSILGGIGKMFGSVWAGIKDTLANLWSVMKGIVAAGIDWVKTKISGVLGAIRGTWDAGWAKLKTGAEKGWSLVRDFVTGIPAKVKGLLGNVGTYLLDSGKALLRGFVDGIAAGFNDAKKTVEGVLGKIREFFPYSPAKRGPFSGKGYTSYSGEKLLKDFGVGISKGARSAAKAAEEAQKRIDANLYAKGTKGAAQKKADQALVKAAESNDRTFAAQAKTLTSVKSSITKTLSRGWGDLTKSADAASSTIRNVMDQLSKVGTTKSKQLRSYLEVQRKDLTAVLKERAKIQEKLKEANADLKSAIKERNDFVSSLSSSLGDTSGSILGQKSATNMVADLEAQLAATKKFKSDLAKLKKLGISEELYEQLASGGVEQGGAAAAALVEGGKKAVSRVNDLSKQVGETASSIAKTVGDELYGAGIKAARGLVNGLKAQDKELAATAKTMGDAIAKAIKKTLKIKSPSRITTLLGKFTGQGLVDGLKALVPGVEKQATELGEAAVPEGVTASVSMDAQVDGAIGDAGISWATGWDSMTDTTASAWGDIEATTEAGATALTSTLAGSQATISKAWAGSWTSVRDQLAAKWSAAKGITDTVKTGISTVKSQLASRMAETSKSWSSAWSGVKATAADKMGDVRDGTVDRFRAMASKVTGVVDGLADGLTGLWARVAEVFRKPINVMIGYVNTGIIGGYNKVAGALDVKKLSTIAKLQKGYAGGGWTGPGSRFKVAGFVHADEQVIKKKSRRRFEAAHPGVLDYINENGELPGYAGGGKVSLQGKTFTATFAAALRNAMKLAGATFNITQGGFRPRTSYSGTSHQGDAVDIARPYSVATVAALRRSGIAAWDRAGKGNWIDHVHGVPLPGFGSPAGSAVWQAQDYLRGGDGLGGRDNGPRGAEIMQATRGLAEAIKAGFSSVSEWTSSILDDAGTLTGVGSSPLGGLVTGVAEKLKTELGSWMKSTLSTGYASGTKSAASGPAWVGEHGPELLWFDGGEVILPASASAAMTRSTLRSASAIDAGPTRLAREDLELLAALLATALWPAARAADTVNNLAATGVSKRRRGVRTGV